MPVVDVATGVEIEYEWRPAGADADLDVQPSSDTSRLPLLLIQGMSGTIHSWGEPFLAALSSHAELLRYGHRGVGASSRVDQPFTTADLAADAAGLLDALAIERAHVLGVSMGGMVAQELALAAPDRVATLTLGCTWAGGSTAVVMTAEAANHLFASKGASTDAAIQASWERNLSAGFRADDVDGSRRETFHAMVLARAVAVSVIALQMQAAATHDTLARLPTISIPTQVVHGTEDEIIPYPNGPIIAGAIPGARLETLDDVGHLWWWEQPERAAGLVLQHAGLA